MLSQVQCLPQTARKLGTKVTPTLFHYILSQSTFSFHPDTPVISIFNAGNKKLNICLIQLWYHFQGYLQTRLIILQMNVLMLF